MHDGNCLFEATTRLVKTSNPHLHAALLRQEVSGHIAEYAKDYKEWCAGGIDFEQQVLELKKNMDIGTFHWGMW